MTDNVIIKTHTEDKGLIPDKWVLGSGLSTDGLYIIHTDAPFMILQFPPLMHGGPSDQIPCVVYCNGEINRIIFNRLFDEAWALMEIYKDRMKAKPPGEN
jgi:hypothetical protein